MKVAIINAIPFVWGVAKAVIPLFKGTKKVLKVVHDIEGEFGGLESVEKSLGKQKHKSAYNTLLPMWMTLKPSEKIYDEVWMIALDSIIKMVVCYLNIKFNRNWLLNRDLGKAVEKL